MTSSFAGYPARYSATRLEQLVDTASVLSPSDGQTLTYDESTAKWTNTANFTVSTVTTDATAGARTYTATEFVGGVIVRDCAGSSRTDVGPTAAALVAAIPGAVVGTSFTLRVSNSSDAAETITMSAGTGGTTVGVMTIAQSNYKDFVVVLTNVTADSEAYSFIA